MLLQDSFTCAARCSEEVIDPDDFGQMNMFPRCWTPHAKAAELVKSLKEQIKERKRTLGRTMPCDGGGGQRYQNTFTASGLQEPVARQHPWLLVVLQNTSLILIG